MKNRTQSTNTGISTNISSSVKANVSTDLNSKVMTKTVHGAGALLLLCVLTLIFSPVARFPSVWILLSVSAVVLVAAALIVAISGAGAAARNLRVGMLRHIGALGWVALPVSAGLLSGLVLSVYPWQGAMVLAEFIGALVVGLTVAILAQGAASHEALKRGVTSQVTTQRNSCQGALEGSNAEVWLRCGIASCCVIVGLGALWLICTPKHSAMVVAWLNSVENMNYWGFAFALLISCSVAVVLSGRIGRLGITVALLTLLAAAALFTWLSLSYPSRGALLAALCSITLLVLLRFTRLPLKWLFAGTAGTFIFACVATFIIQSADWMSYDALNALSSRRLLIYDTTWGLWQQAPWFGWGLEAYKNHGAVEVAKHMGGLFFPAPHNILLEMLYSLGVVGSALVLATLGRILWLAMRATREASNPFAGLLATAIITTLVLHGATDLSIYRPYFFLLVFTAWGLVQGSTPNLQSPQRQAGVGKGGAIKH
ncbi:O-antigen ligase family protein [Paraperlucidibaca sp.]|uniref:O-antigen ligase family protein n=1 Tax=Paraperlucidibaca sp. TaxID=2708021 RepID=UPI00398A463B